MATSLGWDLAVPIFGGVLLGHFLDRWLGTRYIFTLGLLMAGIGIGYYNVARFIRRLEAHERQRADQEGDEEDETG
jgi:F0F1-type ATP synthase assembly protein I